MAKIKPHKFQFCWEFNFLSKLDNENKIGKLIAKDETELKLKFKKHFPFADFINVHSKTIV